MELWVRSQDKCTLEKVTYLSVGGTYRNEILADDCCSIGKYKSNERALEVLDEIQNFMAIKHSYSGTYEEIDIRLKTDIASNMIKIYIMPKE